MVILINIINGIPTSLLFDETVGLLDKTVCNYITIFNYLICINVVISKTSNLIVFVKYLPVSFSVIYDL